jgi:hypothetical protein
MIVEKAYPTTLVQYLSSRGGSKACRPTFHITTCAVAPLENSTLG